MAITKQILSFLALLLLNPLQERHCQISAGPGTPRRQVLHDATGTRWPPAESFSQTRSAHRLAGSLCTSLAPCTHTHMRAHTLKHKPEHDCMHTVCIHKKYMQPGTCIYKLISMNIQIPRHSARVFIQADDANTHACRLTQPIHIYTHT